MAELNYFTQDLREKKQTELKYFTQDLRDKKQLVEKSSVLGNNPKQMYHAYIECFAYQLRLTHIFSIVTALKLGLKHSNFSNLIRVKVDSHS